MKSQILELADLQKWMSENEALYASESKTGRKMTITMNGTIRIYKDGKCVWQGVQPFNAIEKYNEL